MYQFQESIFKDTKEMCKAAAKYTRCIPMHQFGGLSYMDTFQKQQELPIYLYRDNLLVTLIVRNKSAIIEVRDMRESYYTVERFVTTQFNSDMGRLILDVYKSVKEYNRKHILSTIIRKIKKKY